MKAFLVTVGAVVVGTIVAGFAMRTLGGLFAKKPAAAGPVA